MKPTDKRDGAPVADLTGRREAAAAAPMADPRRLPPRPRPDDPPAAPPAPLEDLGPLEDTPQPGELAAEQLVGAADREARVHEDLDRLLAEPSPIKSRGASTILVAGTVAAGLPLPVAPPREALEQLRRANDATASAAALIYAGIGLRVVPLYYPTPAGCSCGRAGCGSAGKHPRIDHWQIEASSDVDTVAAWWRAVPAGNVGLAMGGASRLLTLDVDGEAGRASLAALEATHGPLPVTLASRSGRPDGGEHRLFHVPAGVDLGAIRNQASKLAKGLDVRAEGGQIVVAPSLHRSGNRYQWTTLAPIADLPPWLCERLTSRPAPEVLPPRPSSPARVEALDLLLREFNPRCDPPWSRRELEHKVSGAAGATQVPRGDLLEDDRRPWSPAWPSSSAPVDDERQGEQLGAEAGEDDPVERAERTAIATEPPASILAGAVVVRELLARLTRADARTDLELLDATRAQLLDEAEAERRRGDALGRLAGIALALEGDPDKGLDGCRDKVKAAALLTQARALAVDLDPPDLLAGARFVMCDAPTVITRKAWTFRPFQWIPGRIAMGIGYPGSGKTYALLAALVALSVGRPVWGLSWLRSVDPLTGEARPLRCLLVDIEAGRKDVENRLERFVRGMGVTCEEREIARVKIAARLGCALADVDAPLVGIGLADLVDPGDLILRSYDPADRAAFRQAWAKLARGFDLVVIDPFRDLAPFADENASTIGNLARELGNASRDSGAAFVAIHHDGRIEGKKGQAPRASQYGGRGSSAIDAKAGSQMRFQLADDRSRVRLTMFRDADPDDEEGNLVPLWLRLRRTIGEAEVTAERVEEGDAQGEIPGTAKPAEPRIMGGGSADIDVAREQLRAHPGCAGKYDLVTKIVDATAKRGKRKGGPIGRDRALAAVTVLDKRGEIENREAKGTKGKRPRWYWQDPNAPIPGTADDDVE